MASAFPAFNMFPAPTGGRGAYGAVPGPIGAPASIYSQVSRVAPSLPQLTDATATNIGSELEGTLSPGTVNQLQNRAAAYGVTSGMPGSGLSIQNFLDNIGTTSEALSQQGNRDYLSFLTGVGSTQLDPNLQVNIADRNATLAAAPDPEAAAKAQLSLFDRYSRPSGGGASFPGYGRSASPAAGTSPLWYSPPTNIMATAAGVFPEGTPSSVTNPGAEYSSRPGIQTGATPLDYYNPNWAGFEDIYDPMGNEDLYLS